MANFDMTKWQKKKYARYVLFVDRDGEQEIINKIELEKKKGYSGNQALKNLIMR